MWITFKLLKKPKIQKLFTGIKQVLNHLYRTIIVKNNN